MRLQKLIAGFSFRARGPSTCESCGEPFTCGASLRGCWCSQVKLSEPARAALRARYQRCLCRQCLERFAESCRQDAGAT